MVLVGLFYEKVAGWLLRRTRLAGQEEWLRDGEFQLLKRGYELEGVGGWKREDKDFPITRQDPLAVPAAPPRLALDHASPQAQSRANSSSPDSAHQTFPARPPGLQHISSQLPPVQANQQTSAQ